MKFTTNLSLASLAGAAAALSVACGSLDGHTGTPSTLATLRGEMTTSTNLKLTAAVRVAVVWLSNGPSADVAEQGYNVAEDLPVQPVFPSKFAIQLNEPPPQGAFLRSNQGLSFQVAMGFVVAYEDLNGNGKLDLVQNDAGTFTDKIVGANPQGMALIYVQGTLLTNDGGPLVDSDGKSPSLGYGLYSVVPCAGDGGDAGGIHPCVETHWFDVSSPYDLEISNDSEINQLMCANYGNTGTVSMGTGTGWSVDKQGMPPGGYPAPGTEGLTCTGTAHYFIDSCQVVHNGLCEEITSCTGLSVSLGSAPAPAGWPCP